MLVIALDSSGKKRAVRPKRPDVPECSDALWNLLGRCWKDNKNDRPSSAEVLQVVGLLVLPQIQCFLKALRSAPRSGPHEAWNKRYSRRQVPLICVFWAELTYLTDHLRVLPSNSLKSDPTPRIKVIEFLRSRGVSRTVISKNMSLIEDFILSAERKGLVPTRSLGQ